MRIALFARDIEYKWRDRLCFIINSLKDRGVVPVYYKDLYYKMVEKYRLNIPQGELFESVSDMPEGTDLLLCLGGDGTFLESLTLIRDSNIPVAGVNFGRLGFLTSADSTPGTDWIDSIVAGNYTIEKRCVLEVITPAKFNGVYPFALNEISVQRLDPSMLSVHVKIDGVSLPTYWSDGLVVATSTGSTAYSLSIGGPIVLPTAKVLIMAPIAPHNLNIRPLVIPEDSEVSISVTSRRSGATLCIDNRSLSLENGEEIIIKKANFELNYVSLKDSVFFEALRTKLLWGEDKRNN